jgi:hypothetical protein
MTRRNAPPERPPEIAPAMIDWRGGGASGAYYGFYKERDSVWRADIIACRRGASPRRGREGLGFIQPALDATLPPPEPCLAAGYDDANYHRED